MNSSFEFGLGEDNRQRFRYKDVMNILRRAFSFRRRNHIISNGRSIEDEECSNSVNISNSSTIHSQQSSPSPISSDIASTSRDSLAEASVIYQDPFIALASDGNAYIKFYYEFNPRAEFRVEDIRQLHVRKSSRVIKIRSIKDIYFATYYDLTTSDKIKTWGLSRNDIWWNSHANRMISANEYACVCLNDGSTIKAGFSVVNAEIFLRCLKEAGLSRDCRFHGGIPSPPIARCLIPFIDDE